MAVKGLSIAAIFFVIASALLLLSPSPSVDASPLLSACHFDQVYQLGDSISDTGNLIRESPLGAALPFARNPYGQTFSHHKATGRCSDGLLMIDYIGKYIYIYIYIYISYFIFVCVCVFHNSGYFNLFFVWFILVLNAWYRALLFINTLYIWFSFPRQNLVKDFFLSFFFYFVINNLRGGRRCQWVACMMERIRTIAVWCVTRKFRL